MGLFRTEESMRKWTWFIVLSITLTAVLSILGYYFAVIPAFSAMGISIVQEWGLHIVLILLDIVLSFFVAVALMYFLVIVKYFGKPMRVTKKDKKFTIEKSEEAGRREKGGKHERKKPKSKSKEEVEEEE